MEDDRRYFLKQFRAGLQHCQSEMVDLSLDYKIPFKNRYFLAVNLLMLFSVQSLLILQDKEICFQNAGLLVEDQLLFIYVLLS